MGPLALVPLCKGGPRLPKGLRRGGGTAPTPRAAYGAALPSKTKGEIKKAWFPRLFCAFLPQVAASAALRTGCRKSGLRHFFEVFIAPLRLRRGQGAMQRNPCYARLFADLPYTPPNPIITSGGQSRAPPVAGEARRKPSEQGSARKAPRADAARPLRTALRPPNPPRVFRQAGKSILLVTRFIPIEDGRLMDLAEEKLLAADGQQKRAVAVNDALIRNGRFIRYTVA